MAIFLLRSVGSNLGAPFFAKKAIESSSVIISGLRHGFCSTSAAGQVSDTNSSEPIIPVFQIATQHLNRVALRDKNGTHTYKEILRKSLMLARRIQKKIGPNKSQERIVFLCPNDVTYLLAQWACWASGHIGRSRPFLPR